MRGTRISVVLVCTYTSRQAAQQSTATKTEMLHQPAKKRTGNALQEEGGWMILVREGDCGC